MLTDEVQAVDAEVNLVAAVSALFASQNVGIGTFKDERVVGNDLLLRFNPSAAGRPLAAFTAVGNQRNAPRDVPARLFAGHVNHRPEFVIVFIFAHIA